MNRLLLVSSAAVLLSGLGRAEANTINLLEDGGFETQGILMSVPVYSTGPSGEQWGRSWGSPSTSVSWTANAPVAGAAWSGGSVDRTEDMAAGWKWAHSGSMFGIIKDRQTLSQTFTFSGTEVSVGSLSWFDANRAAWKDIDWFGRANSYNVTLTDASGSSLLIGEYTSEVAGGNNYSTPVGNGWWTDEGKKTWFAKGSLNSFLLSPGNIYTLSFNSLSPYNADGSTDDRTTFLDDILLTATPVPEPETWLLMAVGGLLLAVQRRQASRTQQRN